MTARGQILQRLQVLLDGRPVRWADPDRFIGDYDGRDRTLEVFNADASEQRALLRSMRPIRDELEAVAGGPVVVIFHTRAESSRRHADFVAAHEGATPLHVLSQKIREHLAGATVELASSRAQLDLRVKLGPRTILIEWNRQTGFDIWLVGEPWIDRDPDFRLSDGERALQSVSMLLSEKADGAGLTDELEQSLPSERETANTNASIDAPARLDFEDQIVGKGTRQLPRRAA
jgi:hypothetical protein